MKYCNQCGAEINATDQYCGECGTKINQEETMPEAFKYCSFCDYTTQEDENYCPECGGEMRRNNPNDNYFAEKKAMSSSQKRKEENADNRKKKRASTKTRSNKTGKIQSLDLTENKKKKNGVLRTFGKAIFYILVISVIGIYMLNYGNDDEDRSFSAVENLGDYGKKSREESSTVNVPRLEQKDVIAEKVLTEEDYTLEVLTENVKMIVSPLCIDNKTKAQIHPIEVASPFDNIKIKGYDFTVGQGGEMNGVITIEMPYSKYEIPTGYTAKECISAVHHNENDNAFEYVHYEIDEVNEKLIVSTTELSGIFEVVNLTPNEVPVANGTPDPDASQVFTSNDSWESAGDWGIFYTTNKGDLYERTYKYNFEAAKRTFREYGSKALADKIANHGLKNPDKVNIDAALSLFGKIGYKEYFGKVVLLTGNGEAYDNLFQRLGYKGKSLSEKTKILGDIGMVLAGVQLYYDLQHGSDYAAFKALKAVVYWKGEAMAAALTGPMGATVAGVTLTALFLSEQIAGPIENWNEEQYTKMPEHQKLFSAYNKYYRDRDGLAYRPIKEWWEIITSLNKKALSVKNIPSGIDRATYFEMLLKEELNEYTNSFWTDLSEEERLQLVINSPFGMLYGDWGALHYAGEKNDEVKSMSDYLDEIANEKYPGMILTVAEQYLVEQNTSLATTISYNDNTKMARQYLDKVSKSKEIKDVLIKSMYNYLMDQRIRPLMKHQVEMMYLKEEKALKKNLDVLSNDLNSMLTISVIDNSDGLNKDQPFAHYILVPKSKEISQSGNSDQWKIVLDDEGRGNLSFTTLAYIKSGGFKELEIYKPGTKDFSAGNRNAFVKSVELEFDDDQAIIELKDESNSIHYTIEPYTIENRAKSINDQLNRLLSMIPYEKRDEYKRSEEYIQAKKFLEQEPKKLVFEIKYKKNDLPTVKTKYDYYSLKGMELNISNIYFDNLDKVTIFIEKDSGELHPFDVLVVGGSPVWEDVLKGDKTELNNRIYQYDKKTGRLVIEEGMGIDEEEMQTETSTTGTSNPFGGFSPDIKKN